MAVRQDPGPRETFVQSAACVQLKTFWVIAMQCFCEFESQRRVVRPPLNLGAIKAEKVLNGRRQSLKDALFCRKYERGQNILWVACLRLDPTLFTFRQAAFENGIQCRSAGKLFAIDATQHTAVRHERCASLVGVADGSIHAAWPDRCAVGSCRDVLRRCSECLKCGPRHKATCKEVCLTFCTAGINTIWPWDIERVEKRRVKGAWVKPRFCDDCVRHVPKG